MQVLLCSNTQRYKVLLTLLWLSTSYRNSYNSNWIRIIEWGHGADMQSKVKEIEELYHSFRNRDKMKDDAIAQLSDQLMAISTRLQEERKQQPYIS